jgi:dipeptidyl-peptidase-4
MAIAVAPVTNWRFYDSIYTERYMQTPQENPSGYDENSPINHVDKLKGKFLLIHGSGDECSFTKLNANDGSIDSSEQTV